MICEKYQFECMFSDIRCLKQDISGQKVVYTSQ